MKKILLVSACLMMLNSVVGAAPLTDYAKGNTAVDINWFPSMHMTDKYSGSQNGKDNADAKRATYSWGLTTGIDGKWAVQYQQFNPKVDRDTANSFNFGMKTQEFNVLYKVDSNLAAFAGWHQTKYDYASTGVTYSTEKKNVLQVGLIGVTPIAPKMQLFGVVGFGKDLANYEIGASYDLAKNIDFNLFYRYTKVKNLASTESYSGMPYNFDDDVTAKGIGYGITYKF